MVVAVLAGVPIIVSAVPSVALAQTVTKCPGHGDFGAVYLSASWPGGFKGVPVYSNGTAKYASNCYNYASTPSGHSVKTGMEWQCVELVNRLYITKGWIDQTWSGDGDQLYYNPPVNPATGKQLVTQRQGSIKQLAPGDVMSFSDTAVPGGHAAVVGAVSGTSITFVNQNTSKSNVLSYGRLSGGNLTMTGWKGYTPIGAIDAPANSSGGGYPAVAETVSPSGARYIDLFTVAGNGAVHSEHWDSGANAWSSAFTVPGGITAAKGSSPAVAETVSPSGARYIDLFTVAGNGAVHSEHWDSGANAWSSAFTVPGGI
jgi:CHAP domain